MAVNLELLIVKNAMKEKVVCREMITGGNVLFVIRTKRD